MDDGNVQSPDDDAASRLLSMGERRRLALGRVRAERNRRLAATDWQALRAIEQGRLPEFRMGGEAARRQARRDLPARLGAEGALERLADCGALNRFEPTWP